MIIPFWNRDLYNSDYYGDRVLFRISYDEELLNSVGSSISEAFFSAFSPTSLFIATWVESEGTLQQNIVTKLIN